MATERVNDARPVAKQAPAYIAFGALNTLVVLGNFYVLDRWVEQIDYMVALIVASAVGVVTGFLLQRTFVFRVRGRLFTDFWRYTSVTMTGIALNLILLPLFVEIVGLEPWPSQLASTVVVFLLTYTAHRLFSFRR
jgi:putative flippase GtrA